MLKIYKTNNTKMSSTIYIPVFMSSFSDLKFLESQIGVKFLTRLKSSNYIGNFMEKISFEIINKTIIKKGISIPTCFPKNMNGNEM